jgi:CheY-like chemotaxis protein
MSLLEDTRGLMSTDGTHLPLDGRAVLIAEDNFTIADDLRRAFAGLGASVIGPVPDLGQALHIARTEDQLDGAVLDINLRGLLVFPVAEILCARGVPFVFATGYDQTMVPAGLRHVPRCEKPIDPVRVALALFD